MSLKHTTAARIEQLTGTPRNVTIDLVEKLVDTNDMGEVETHLLDLISYFTDRHQRYTNTIAEAAECAVRSAMDEVADDWSHTPDTPMTVEHRTRPTPLALSGDQLLHKVTDAIETYVLMPSPDHVTAVALWIAATHAATSWDTATRLVIRAPEKRCGKSRLLCTVEALCYNPVRALNASVSAMYRVIGTSPTILIDEADTIFRPKANDHEDLRGLLNAGHRRGRPAFRWNPATREVERFETYAMAALTSIGQLPDSIENQAVVIPMRRRAGGEHIRPYRARRDQRPLTELRKQLHTWVQEQKPELQKATPAMALKSREADTWEPLIAVADAAGGDWPTKARTAAQTLTDQTTTSTHR